MLSFVGLYVYACGLLARCLTHSLTSLSYDVVLSQMIRQVCNSRPCTMTDAVVEQPAAQTV